MSTINTFNRLSASDNHLLTVKAENENSEQIILINEQSYLNEIALRLFFEKLGYQSDNIIKVDMIDDLLQDNCDYMDLIVIGVSCKEPSLIEKLQQIFNLIKKGKRVLVHCQSYERNFWVLLASLGIKGLIIDSESKEEFTTLIFNLMQGGITYSTEILKLIGTQNYKMLSPVEGNLILELLSGKRVTDIARINGRDVRTVSAQKVSVMKHLKIRDDGELYALGGMITRHLGQPEKTAIA